MKISDICKSFLLKIYLFLAVFLVIFLASYIYGYINNTTTIIDKGTYVSVGEIAISQNTTNSLDTYMQNIIYRSKNQLFTEYVINAIEKEKADAALEENDSFFKDLGNEELEIISKLEGKDINNNLSLAVIEKTTIFKISFSDRNAKVAQAVNNVIIESIETILKDDKDNILGGKLNSDGIILKFSIDKKASLPTSLSNSIVNNESSNLSMMKVIIISFAVYVVLVILVDFVLAYVTNKQKAINMVHLDLVSEIEIPYFNNRKNTEEN